MPPVEYTTDHFTMHTKIWENLFGGTFRPRRALEVGSHQGRSAEWLLDHVPGIEMTCVDIWEAAEATDGLDNIEAEKIFDARVGHRVNKLKGRSSEILKTLVPHYDFIYIDGDHKAPAVLEDLVLAFSLLLPCGIMVCDDYTGGWGLNPLHYPKMAIDAFVNCYQDKIDLIMYPISQIFIVKK